MKVYSNFELGKNLKSPYKEIWEIGNATGLRISDIIKLKVKILSKGKPTITEQKTGKKKRIYIPKKTKEALIKMTEGKAPEDYIFSSSSESGHLTRQAVFKAFKKAGKNVKYNIGTHTMRQNYAMRMKEKNKGLKYVQGKLNHASLGETLLYLQKGAEENEQSLINRKN